MLSEMTVTCILGLVFTAVIRAPDYPTPTQGDWIAKNTSVVIRPWKMDLSSLLPPPSLDWCGLQQKTRIVPFSY